MSDAEIIRTNTPDLGLPPEAVEGIVKVLTTLLADETLLYLKLRKYHWNVRGMSFAPLHAAFEEQYDALAEVIDTVAERIRQYGALAIGTMAEFQEHARLSEQPGHNPDARTMIEELVADHEALIRYLREDIETLDDLDDEGAEDLLIGLMQDHQKKAWLLRAHLEA